MTVSATRLFLIGTALCALLVLAACTERDTSADSPSDPRSAMTASSDQNLLQEAIDFGSLVLPPDTEVLQVRADRGLDTSFRLVLRTDPDGLTRLLTESKFERPLIQAFPPYDQVLAGPSLDTSPAVHRAQDRYQNSDGQTVYRTITVDERDSDTRFVHVAVHTT